MANKPIRKIASFKNTLIHLQLPIFLLQPEVMPYIKKLTSSAACNIEPIHQGASYVCSQSRAQKVYLVHSFNNNVAPQFLSPLILCSDFLQCISEGFHIIVLEIHDCASRKMKAILYSPVYSLIPEKGAIKDTNLQKKFDASHFNNKNS